METEIIKNKRAKEFLYKYFSNRQLNLLRTIRSTQQGKFHTPRECKRDGSYPNNTLEHTHTKKNKKRTMPFLLR